MNTDPLADMITRIRNAYAVGKKEVTVPVSRFKEAVAICLGRGGYLKKVERADGMLRITLAYQGKTPAVRGLKRISKPGLRMYQPAGRIPKIVGGLGMSVISTSRGILSDSECRKEHIGGEVVAHVW